MNPCFPADVILESFSMLDIAPPKKNYVQYSIDEVIMISSLYDRVK